MFTLKIDCGHSLEQPYSFYIKHPMPYTVIFTAILKKTTIFKLKIVNFFSYLCSKQDSGHRLELHEA